MQFVRLARREGYNRPVNSLFRQRDKCGMKELVSPKQVARAIGVSESSLKRWCDRGLIHTIRTAGGHRKLPIRSVLEFIKESGREVVHPDLLGLPSLVGQGPRTLTEARNRLIDALIAGDEQAVRRILIDLVMSKHPISAIGDEVISSAYREIGDRWDCGDVEVYQERRSCEICLRALHDMRTLLSPVVEGAPLAMGGTLSGDYYTLPTTLVELVLRENVWNAHTLGSGLPVDTLVTAIAENRPRLFWISTSYVPDEDQYVAEIAQIFAAAKSHGAALAVGGAALTESLRKRMKYHAYCDTLAHLETFASTLRDINQN